MEQFYLTIYLPLIFLVIVHVEIKEALTFSENLIEKVEDIEKETQLEALKLILHKYPTNITGDGLLDFEGLAKKYCSNPVEAHYITTEDGYILTVFRIKGNVSNPVIMSHGLFGTSDDFFMKGDTSLIYTLAEENYDVWAINYRGNRYSRNHTTLNPNYDNKFWGYSFNEWGYYDLPAVIDHVLEKTGEKQVKIIGHSEGTTAVFVLGSTRPEYNEKIKFVVALAPVAYLTNISKGLKLLISLKPIIEDILKLFNIHEILGHDSVSTLLFQTVCSFKEEGFDLCVNVILGALIGEEHNNLGREFFQNVVLGHTPAGTSRRNLLHFAQVSLSGEFKKYDFGELENYAKYDSENPPEYNLGNVTCKMAFIVGLNDEGASAKDAKRIQNQLPNVVEYYVLSDPYFNHLDFLWGRNLKKVLIPKVLSLLADYD